ncbi:hypothetical protein DO021_21560 [Desulfobacter hydrogenophilus]|uniref:Uncharacterized protein n=1 Tax=Desulfobacter hydrogenophilus TaxID=2291 RepID=A0A328FA25_9BACT|nr:hypothetical protein [Desulfobacter hydrogenophilus]NDY74455.1 hypothetical protein [Desulfobacter hydrogenophilus]QBH14293.1 hypothetical protein EYB58_16045 [Desulfobacter hydrogenophilus]RAL99984.1 hypothetical protein DO021_21560 [Desulfobacter hydrogenophilus]
MSNSKTMTPEEIKFALDKAGLSMSGLARDLRVSPGVVCQVVNNKSISHRIRCHVARAIGRPVDEIWNIKKDPTRTGRPLGRGLYDHEQCQAAVV